jgi:hypothetical protein
VGAKAIWREDLVTSLLGSVLVAGLFLDGWNHINLQNGALGGFFTIWHALLYAGFNGTALWVVTRNPHLYTRGAKPAPYFHKLLGIPLRYPLAIGGLAIATVGLFGDIAWHTAFGEETGVARVIAPFHLLLFAGAAGLVSAPLRSAWYAPQFYPSTLTFRRILPPLLSVALVTCVAAFMFQWLNAFLDWTPSVTIGRIPGELASDARIKGTTEFAGAARILVTNLILLAPLFLVLRRWRLPFGSATLLFVMVSFAMSALTSFEHGATVVAALVGGLVADALIDGLRPDADRTFGYRVVAAVTPLALWATYFLILIFVYRSPWPLDLWLGTTLLAAISGLLLSYIAIPPALPESAVGAPARSGQGPIDLGGGGDMATPPPTTGKGMSRRGFLTGLGIGLGAAGAAGVATGISLGRTELRLSAETPGNFSRMFPNLPPFFDELRPGGATDQLRDAMRDIGKLGGLLDAKDAIAAGPVALIANAAVNGNDPPTNPDNPTHTAGVTFFGQFMDLDVTFDSRSTLGVPTDPTTTPNMRIPYFDLDIVYGQGPFVTPTFYDVADPAKLRIESGGIFEDLPRNPDMTAIIPDPRSDQNMMVSGLHCAFILFHNKTVDYVRSQLGLIDPAAIFAEAKRLTLWHYHWLILNEFLPLFVGPAMLNDIMTNGRRFFRPAMGLATMPIEFQGACFRVGHTMLRPSYRANLKGMDGNPFFGFIFDPALGDITPAPGLDPADLRSGFRAPRRFIGWQTFFDFKDGEVKRNKLIDSKISTPLFTLPLGAIASHKAPTSLMQRNLLRHITWSMPSGQAIAREMGVDRLSAADLEELRVYDMDLEKSTPLFYYMLKESALVPNTDIGRNSGGFHMGPVGGRIVAEVVIGLLQSDPASWVARQPLWTPTLQNPGMGFRMVDFLTFAGVDPATRRAQKPTYA